MTRLSLCSPVIVSESRLFAGSVRAGFSPHWNSNVRPCAHGPRRFHLALVGAACYRSAAVGKAIWNIH